jgi:Family of unknown function (DUF5670)
LPARERQPLTVGRAEAVRLRDSPEAHVLWTIAVVLIVLWLLGFITNVAGSLIHLLLVIAIIVVAYQLIAGRRSV